MKSLVNGTIIEDEDGDVTMVPDNLLANLINAGEQIQTMLPSDGTQPPVRTTYSMITHKYYEFHKSGIKATVRTDLFNTLPDRVYEMEMAENQDGSRKYDGDDIRNFKYQWCANRCKAGRNKKWTAEAAAQMVDFLLDIVFEGEDVQRTADARKITIYESVKQHNRWDTYKFRIQVGVDAFSKFETKISKLLAKKKKKELNRVEAASLQATYIQAHMKLKPGMYVTAQGFGAYFEEMYRAVFESGAIAKTESDEA